MKRVFYFMLIVLMSQNIHSQIYIPIDTANLPVRTEAARVYRENAKQFYNSIKDDYQGSERSYIKKKYELLDKDFVEDIQKGEYLFNTPFNKKLDEIVQNIISANPILNQDLKFYISKSVSLNAASMGNKNFVLKLGSFYYLQNESQLASVVSHEIAHYILKHALIEIQRRYKLEKGSDYKDEIYEIKKDNTNKGEKAYNKLKGILYEGGKSSRRQEYEADSLGYILIKNTNYNKTEYMNSLRLIEQYDTIRPVGLKLETYKKIFNLPSQPFKEDWLKTEDFSNYDYSKYKEKYNEDSIRSHPETELRIVALKRIYPELNKVDAPQIASPEFKELQNIAKLEQPASLLFQEEYGLGIYFCLYCLQNEDNVDYNKKWLGEYFQKIYNARKEYKLNRYLERVDPKNQSESYKQFLNFMWNLNLSEIKVIADYYNQRGS